MGFSLGWLIDIYTAITLGAVVFDKICKTFR